MWWAIGGFVLCLFVFGPARTVKVLWFLVTLPFKVLATARNLWNSPVETIAGLDKEVEAAKSKAEESGNKARQVAEALSAYIEMKKGGTNGPKVS